MIADDTYMKKLKETYGSGESIVTLGLEQIIDDHRLGIIFWNPRVCEMIDYYQLQWESCHVMKKELSYLVSRKRRKSQIEGIF